MTKRSKEMLRKNYQRSRPSGELSSTAKYQSLIAELTQLDETRRLGKRTCIYTQVNRYLCDRERVKSIKQIHHILILKGLK